MENEKNLELNDIISLIRNNSGYLLYFHCGGRDDLYDQEEIDSENIGRKREYFKEYDYVRADSGFLEEIPNKLGKFVYQNNVEDIRIKEHHKEDVKRSYETLSLSKLKSRKGEEYTEILEDETLLSKLKLKKPNKRKIKKTKYVDVDEKLSNLIKNENSHEDAYLLSFTLEGEFNDKIYDDVGRDSPFPTIIKVVSNKENLEQVMNYLKENPEDYHKLIEGIFPEEEFPNVNKWFIKNQKRMNAVVFYNQETNESSLESMIDNEYLTEDMMKEKEDLMKNPVFEAFVDYMTIGMGGCRWGIPLDELEKKVGRETIKKQLPKILQLRSMRDGVKVMIDYSHFGDVLFRGVNGKNGDRVRFEQKKDNKEIIESYLEDGVLSKGIANNHGYGYVSTSKSPIIPFTSDGGFTYTSPDGHVLTLTTDEEDEIESKTIENIDEVIIKGKIPSSRIELIYTLKEDAEELLKHEEFNGKIVGHPWKTQKALIYHGFPEFLVLNAKESGLSKPRYNTPEETESAINKAIETKPRYSRENEYVPIE